MVLVLTALAQKQAHEAEIPAGHTRLAVVMETRHQSLMTFKLMVDPILKSALCHGTEDVFTLTEGLNVTVGVCLVDC